MLAALSTVSFIVLAMIISRAGGFAERGRVLRQLAPSLRHRGTSRLHRGLRKAHCCLSRNCSGAPEEDGGKIDCFLLLCMWISLLWFLCSSSQLGLDCSTADSQGRKQGMNCCCCLGCYLQESVPLHDRVVLASGPANRSHHHFL